MDIINTLLEYVYVPLGMSIYSLHMRVTRIDTRLEDYMDLKKDIYMTLKTLEKDVHHLIKIREEEK